MMKFVDDAKIQAIDYLENVQAEGAWQQIVANVRDAIADWSPKEVDDKKRLERTVYFSLTGNADWSRILETAKNLFGNFQYRQDNLIAKFIVQRHNNRLIVRFVVTETTASSQKSKRVIDASML